MRTGIIYCATSRTTGKRYVGQTVRTLDKRRQSHESCARKGSLMCFHSALRKYGADDFTWEILDTVAIENIDDAETRHIARLKTAEKAHGYNIAVAGGNSGMLGMKRGPHSEEHRRRISEAHKGKKTAPEHLKKLWAGRAKWSPTVEQRIAIGLANKGRKHTDEARRNMSDAQKGRVITDEHRRRMSASHLGKPGRSPSAAERQRVSEKLKGHPVSAETRKKISDSLKRRNAEGVA